MCTYSSPTLRVERSLCCPCLVHNLSRDKLPLYTLNKLLLPITVRKYWIPPVPIPQKTIVSSTNKNSRKFFSYTVIQCFLLQAMLLHEGYRKEESVQYVVVSTVVSRSCLKNTQFRFFSLPLCIRYNFD